MTPLIMPQVGQDIECGTVVKWLKHQGDAVHKGEVILTVESEKASFDVEAEVDGVLLRTLFAEGQEAKVLEPVGWIGSPTETVLTQPSTQPQIAHESTTAASPATSPAVATTAGKPSSSPSARRTASEIGRSLEGVTGTGPGGRIVRRDVLAATPEAEPRPGADTELPFDRLRTVIAQRLTLAWRTIPHFHLSRDIDMEAAFAWRSAFNARAGHRASVTDLVCRAAVLALREHPRLNAHVAEDRLTLKSRINLGIAVATDRGLFVPVVPDADSFDLQGLAEETRRLAGEARAGRLPPGAAGTFTVTSLGMHGISSFQPIINTPECAILAVGEAAPRPVARDGLVGVRRLMTVTLGCDHRAVDGAYAAGFLARLADLLARPAALESGSHA